MHNSENNFIPIIKEFTKSPKILDEHLQKGIVKQNGSVIFLNVILDQASSMFNEISEYKNINLHFSYALEKGVNECKDQIVPVIISFHAIHEEYRIFSITINVRVDKDCLTIE